MFWALTLELWCVKQLFNLFVPALLIIQSVWRCPHRGSGPQWKTDSFFPCLFLSMRVCVRSWRRLYIHSSLVDTQICTCIPPYFNLFSLPLSLLHKCQIPHLKAFCTDLRGGLHHSRRKSFTPVTLLCWYSSTIFYFVCLLQSALDWGQGNALWDYQEV